MDGAFCITLVKMLMFVGMLVEGHNKTTKNKILCTTTALYLKEQQIYLYHFYTF